MLQPDCLPLLRVSISRGLVEAARIKAVEGEFYSQEAVQLCDENGNEVARGIVNYSSAELQQIQGHHSQEIPTILGYSDAETVVHRDNLVISP